MAVWPAWLGVILVLLSTRLPIAIRARALILVSSARITRFSFFASSAVGDSARILRTTTIWRGCGEFFETKLTRGFSQGGSYNRPVPILLTGQVGF